MYIKKKKSMLILIYIFLMFNQLREETWSKETQKKNWFSVPSALNIYSSYLELDKDQNGLLSRQEITGYALFITC